MGEELNVIAGMDIGSIIMLCLFILMMLVMMIELALNIKVYFDNKGKDPEKVIGDFLSETRDLVKDAVRLEVENIKYKELAHTMYKTKTAVQECVERSLNKCVTDTTEIVGKILEKEKISKQDVLDISHAVQMMDERIRNALHASQQQVLNEGVKRELLEPNVALEQVNVEKNDPQINNDVA